MRNESGSALYHQANRSLGLNISRTTLIGSLLIVALFAFEIFNFDTTRFALRNLLGEISFWGLQWATILAIAFCAIDFAGLARLFTPEQGREEPAAVWYLMGAWLLGATMNAIMTWWAVSLTLLSHDLGNEVVSREQLLQAAPIFVAALVWLTRILFIGSLSVAGDYLFASERPHSNKSAQPKAPGLTAPRPRETAVPLPKRQAPNNRSRIRQRPPMSRPTPTPAGMRAQSPQRDRSNFD